MDLQIKKQELIKEYNALETRQREILGALRLIEEMGKEPPKIKGRIIKKK